MHLETSISLATVPVMGVRATGGCTVVADRRLISSDCNDMSILSGSRFFHIHQERLEFRCLRIAVTNRWRQRVNQVARLGEPLVSEVNRQSDVVHFLAVDDQSLDPLGHHRLGDDVAALGRDLDPVAMHDPDFLAQLFADFDKLLGLDDGVQARMLGPVVEVLGQAVAGGRVRIVFLGTQVLAVVRENPCARVVVGTRVVRVHGVVAHRRLERLVVLGERTLGQRIAREETRHAFGQHDERTHAVFRRFVAFVVGHIRARPGGAVPRDQLAGRIERLAVDVARGAVVQHAAVGRPGPGPVQRIADAGRVAVVAAAHLVALRGPRTGKDPATGRRAAVVAQLRKAGQLLVLLEQQLGRILGVVDVLQRLAVEFHRELFRLRIERLGIVPRQVQDRVGEHAAILLVRLLDALEQLGHDFQVAARLARRLRPLPVPLQHARGTDQRAAFFREARGWQAEHFGHDLAGIDLVEVAIRFPEVGRFRLQRIHHHQPLELGQAFGDLLLVRRRRQDVEALADIAGHLALVHQLERLQNVVRLVELGQIVERVVVLFGSGIAPPGLHERDQELLRVAVVAELVRTQRFERALAHVGVPLLFGFTGQGQVTGQHIGQQAQVGQTLDVGVTAQGVHAAACNADVTEQQLHHRARAQGFRAGRVLRPAQGVQDGRSAARYGSGGQRFGHQVEFLRRDAARLLHHGRCVARIVFLHQLVHAARVLQGRVDLGIAVVAELVVPAALVGVLAGRFVPARVQAVVEIEVFTDDERHVRVIADVFVLDLVVGEQVVDDTAQEHDIRTGTRGNVMVGHGSGSGKARVDHDQLGATMRLGFRHPFKAARMRFSCVAAHDQDDIGILDVYPVIRHRATSKCRGKTCHPHFVAGGRGGQHAGGGPAVDGLAVRGLFDEVRVAVRLHQLGDARERVIPGDGRPFGGARCPVLRRGQAVRRMDKVDQAGAFRAQGAAVDRVVGVAFDMDDRSGGVFGAVAQAIHQDPAPY
uniref:Uncharacterized protein n=1 Tax=Tanacetum cinerariifolium TaxID=118510 RepID=A0A699GER5_TANCI|nr:hypothetical protein [Tanacetum cinerariifolium]